MTGVSIFLSVCYGGLTISVSQSSKDNSPKDKDPVAKSLEKNWDKLPGRIGLSRILMLRQLGTIRCQRLGSTAQRDDSWVLLVREASHVP